jgi:cyclohexyl-isocyanide hydratase
LLNCVKTSFDFTLAPSRIRLGVKQTYPKIVSAAGVTAGIDGALRVAADLRGADVAHGIQLAIAYAPEPPFNSGTPDSAPPTVLEQVRSSYQPLTEQREQTARRVAERLGIAVAR